MNNSIACFISPHGFGHAARLTAIMEALRRLDPSIRFEIFTLVPCWFFASAEIGEFGYHETLTDIGLVQDSPYHEDLSATVKKLEVFMPFDPVVVKGLADKLRLSGCRLALCDISPLGIAAAAEAGIPSVLISNFTWDWIYEGYEDGGLLPYVKQMKEWFDRADYYILAEPYCEAQPADIIVPPVSRSFKAGAGYIRERLGIPADAKAVMITMGGFQDDYGFYDMISDYPDIYFVIPADKPGSMPLSNLITLPFHSDLHHPDLVNAVDAVVCKLGYSTLAEIYHAGVPYGYITRPAFRESAKLQEYVEKQMNCMQIDLKEFKSGGWLRQVRNLVKMPRIQRDVRNGADQAAEFISRI
ncbi:hypothetical protein H8E50_04015 [bacterium]|nr:hypothetical protein [bacterium]